MSGTRQKADLNGTYSSPVRRGDFDPRTAWPGRCHQTWLSLAAYFTQGACGPWCCMGEVSIRNEPALRTSKRKLA